MNEQAKKPAVLVFSTAYKPLIGGAELAVEEIARRLKDEYEFIIITARLRRTSRKIEKVPEGTVIRLGVGISWIDKLLLPFLGVLAVRKYSKNRPAIFWGVMVSYASVATFFAKIFEPQIPFVLTIQEGNHEWERFPSSLWWRIFFLKTRPESAAADRRAPFVNHVICISNFLADRVREKGYRGPISIIPNGVDKTLFEIPKLRYEQNTAQRDWAEPACRTGRHSNPPAGGYARSASNVSFGIKSAPIIFSASRLVYKNGIDILLEAAGKIKDEFFFEIILAGDGPDRKKLEEMTTRIGLTDRVQFLGTVLYEDLPTWYAKSNIFVRPSRSEGLGSAFLEAMAAGLITIGTPVGGIPDFLEDGKTGFLTTQNNSDDLARVLRRIFVMTAEERAIIIRNARAVVEKRFLWNTVADHMKIIFQNL